ncbi:MAG: UvrD-helicase domain-containing protein [Proteobacteria bacterium]|nr:UvrD-helicase domain-containing protein [Pseudomonadota bacterium]
MNGYCYTVFFRVQNEDYLQDLNPSQLEAVTYGLGPLLIFAGAGSGKTRVLTRRIAHLIHNLGASPHEILAVTFTNKAAREMKERVEALFENRALPIWVSTFHSSCVRILRKHAEMLSFSSNFVIYDTSDSLSALKRVFKKLNIDPKMIEPRSVLSIIDKAKNDFKTAEDIRNDFYIGREFAQTAAQIYTAYQEELQLSNAMDFSDLLFNVVTLFKLEPKLLESYQEKFKFVLVDEYQDTNKVQYLLIKQLTAKYKNITVVGDDDQSIYSFRGANIETILNFKKDFPDAKAITLNVNYRCSKNILAISNQIIKQNQQRQPKNITTVNPEGNKITCFKAYDEQDEAEFVSREIAILVRHGKQPKDIAIFYRTNAQSRAIEEALFEIGLPYQIFGGHKFYERKEIKDILAYLKLLTNPKDNEALLRIINTPARGIGNTAIAQLVTFANKQTLSLYDAILAAIKSPESTLGKTVCAKLQKFIDIISKLQDQLDAANTMLANDFAHDLSNEVIANLIKGIALDSGYVAALKAQEKIEADSKIENIDELARVAIDFVERSLEQGAKVSINDFLDRASLSSDLETENTHSENVNEQTKPLGQISLMTLHLAKGLEFDTVFLIGLEEGILPHSRSLNDKQALEEERRLCYVGITRAKKHLYLLRASDRQSFGRNAYYTGIPSRFIAEIPRDVVEDRKSGFFTFGEEKRSETYRSRGY